MILTDRLLAKLNGWNPERFPALMACPACDRQWCRVTGYADQPERVECPPCRSAVLAGFGWMWRYVG